MKTILLAVALAMAIVMPARAEQPRIVTISIAKVYDTFCHKLPKVDALYAEIDKAIENGQSENLRMFLSQGQLEVTHMGGAWCREMEDTVKEWR